MKDDLISRQAAIDALNDMLADYIPCLIGRDEEIPLKCAVAIRELPSAQRWIPTSERLPEGIGQVIVQTNGGAIHEVFYEGGNDYGHEVWMRLDGCIYWDDEVVAWMPLPEPWKGEQNE